MANTATTSLNLKILKRFIADGKLDKVLSELITFIENTDTSVTTEIYLASARFRKLVLEKRRGEINTDDYTTEFNSITVSLLGILNDLSNTDPKSFKGAPSKEQLREELKALSEEFAETDNMTSKVSEFRMKIHIARKMGEKFIMHPELMKEYMGTSDPAIICAIGRKVKIVADINDLAIIESLVPMANSNLTRGFITNALAEFIYSGQLRFGDEIRMRKLLKDLGRNADPVLLSNVMRVSTMLDLLAGKADRSQLSRNSLDELKEKAIEIMGNTGIFKQEELKELENKLTVVLHDAGERLKEWRAKNQLS